MKYVSCILLSVMLNGGVFQSTSLPAQQDDKVLQRLASERAKLKRQTNPVDRARTGIKISEILLALATDAIRTGDYALMEDHLDQYTLTIQEAHRTMVKTGRDAQNRVFPECESNQPFHPASHHGNREERILEYNKICKFRVGQMAYFLDKMKHTMDGDASLLDKSLIIWGSPMADPNIHNHRRCPLVLLGHANGALKGNLHLKAAEGTPMANVMLTLLHQLGADDIQSFGDSTGEFALTAPLSTDVAP